MWLLILVAGSLFAQGKGDPDAAYKLLRREYYGLINSIRTPEKWREAVTHRKAFLAKLRKRAAEDAALAAKLARLIERTERSIAFDGVDVLGANRPRRGWPEPLGDALDVVAWVGEDDHLRVALGNPTTTPRKVRVGLRRYVSKEKPPDWPVIATTDLDVTPEEVVVVRFEGIPTVGEDRGEPGYAFHARAGLIEDGDVKGTATLQMQNGGGWADRASTYLTKGAQVNLTVPGRGRRGHTIYIPRTAHARRRDLAVPVHWAAKPVMIRSEHGYFLTDAVATFALELPPTKRYDLVRVDELVGRFHSGSMITEWAKPGARILQLGTETRVRHVSVKLPAKHRFDARPLSDDPAERAAQLVPRFRTSLWRIRENAERQVVAIGKPAVPVMVEILARRGANAGYRRTSSMYECERSAKRVLKRIGAPAVDELTKLLHNPHWRPRHDAAEVLAAVGGRGVDVLLEASDHDDPGVRVAALVGLRQTKDARRVDAIRRLTRDPDKDVRSRAVSTLPSVVPKEEGIDLLLEALASPQAGRRRWAIDRLNERKATQHAMRIARMLKDADADVRGAAANALGKFGDARTLPALLAASRDTSLGVRRSVVWSLGHFATKDMIKSDATAVFVALLFDVDEDVRSKTAFILGGMRAERAAHYLVNALGDPPDRASRSVKYALERLGYRLSKLEGKERYALVPPADARPLPAALTALVDCLGEKSYHRRLAARDALVKRGEKAAGLLRRAVAEPKSALQRVWAVQTLGRINSPIARDTARPLLLSEDPMLAYAAAEAPVLAADEKTFPMWQRLLSSDDYVLRMRAAEALGRTGRKDAVPILIGHLGDKRAEVRRKVIWSLGELRDPAAVDALFERFVNRKGGDTHPLVARPGVKLKPREIYPDYGEHGLDFEALREALVKIGAPAAPRLVPAVEFGWGPVQEKATSALIEIGPPAIPAIIRALESEDHQTRNGAAKVLRSVKPPPVEAVGALVRAANVTHYCPAFDTLVVFGDAAAPKLVDALADPKQAFLSRATAAALLVKLGDRSGWAVLEEMVAIGKKTEMNILLRRMGTLQDPAFLPLFEQALTREDVWAESTRSAAQCGGKDAIPLLRKALKHPDKKVREWAKRWIDRLNEEK